MSDYLTVSEAAVMMRVNPQTVRAWLRSGALRGLRFGGAWRTCTPWIEEFGQRVQTQRKPGRRELEARSRKAMDAAKNLLATIQERA